ncbi:MAG: radical SAM protein [Myxococcota bacterium]
MERAETRARPVPFTLRVEAEGALLYRRADHAYTRRTAAESFLMVASRELPLDDAVDTLARSVGTLEAQQARADLEALGVFGLDGVFAGRIVELPRVHQGYGAPLVAHLGVTLACNFSCAHCYSSSGKRAPGELTFKEIAGLVEQLAEMGCVKLVLGGGEPFLRKDLPRVVRKADEVGVDTFVHTNASLLKPAVLQALSECPPAGLSVSLDGPDEDTNDAIRGPGTFQKALRGMLQLREHYAPGFNISVTITPRNAPDAARMVELAHQEGARVLLLRPAYPAGEAQANPGLVCDRDTFSRAIDRARVRAAELGVTLDAPHPEEAGEPDFPGFGCVAGKVVMGISPTGNVTPCLNLPGAYESGNVRETLLWDLWAGGAAFTQLRAIDANAQCMSCRHHDTCRGGCRVRALYAGNGLEGPDSWCHYEPREGMAPVTFPRRGASLLRVVG